MSSICVNILFSVILGFVTPLIFSRSRGLFSLLMNKGRGQTGLSRCSARTCLTSLLR